MILFSDQGTFILKIANHTSPRLYPGYHDKSQHFIYKVVGHRKPDFMEALALGI